MRRFTVFPSMNASDKWKKVCTTSPGCGDGEQPDLDGQLVLAHNDARRNRRHAREGEEEGLGNVVGDVRLFDVGGRLVEVGEAEHERVIRRAGDPAAPLRRGAAGAVDDVEGEDGRRRNNHGSRGRRPLRRGRCHISQRRCSRAAGC